MKTLSVNVTEYSKCKSRVLMPVVKISRTNSEKKELKETTSRSLWMSLKLRWDMSKEF
jgi:hypothetical protein